MPLAVLASLALAGLGQPTQDRPTLRGFHRLELASALDGERRLYLRIPDHKLDPPKVSPKHDWTFEWIVNGMIVTAKQEEPRFRVFSQFRRGSLAEDPAVGVTRMLLRMWDLNSTWLRLDHSPMFLLRSVDVYLCYGGKAGGEHLFDWDVHQPGPDGQPTRVNTVYIYQITEVTSPLEFAREVAHEYGHATLPPVKVPGGREDWANGDVGERVFLRWLRDLLVEGKLTPSDTLGATPEAIQGYLDRQVVPLVTRVATKGPDRKALAEQSDRGFDEYVALVCTAQWTLPLGVLRRSLVLTNGQAPLDYEKALREAFAESPTVPVTIPPFLRGQAIWIPLGEGRVTGGKVLARRDGWAKVQPTGALTVTNPTPKD